MYIGKYATNSKEVPAESREMPHGEFNVADVAAPPSPE
jgi:hypothetical protein